MKKSGLFVIVALVVAACGGNKNEVSVHTRIEQYEDSIRQWGGGQGFKQDRMDFADRYITVLLEAYEEDPENPKTPAYLDRVHMWYATKADAKNAVKWAELLLEKYPGYENREMLLESLAVMYDGEITPRDSVKVREYYMQLLKEFPEMDEENKEAIKERLKYNHLTLDEYIMKQVMEQSEDPAVQ